MIGQRENESKNEKINLKITFPSTENPRNERFRVQKNKLEKIKKKFFLIKKSKKHQVFGRKLQVSKEVTSELGSGVDWFFFDPGSKKM